MRDAEEMLFSGGWRPQHAARMLAQKHDCSVRQAHRYVTAVRALYRQASERTPGTTLEEMCTILQATAAQAKQLPEPDMKAAIKAYELAARLQGWLDRRSTVTVQGTIGLQPLPALEGASDEEIALLAQYHDARARRLAAQAEVVGQLPALTKDGA